MKKRVCLVLCFLHILFLLSACSSPAADLVKKIDALGLVSLHSEKEIAEAEAAYEALSDSEKEKVNNYEQLTYARSRFERLKKEDKDRQEAVSLSEKILTKMGKTFKSPLNLSVLNIWYSHYGSSEENYESWYFTFQISAPNSYGTYLNEYYGMSLTESDTVHGITQLDEMLSEEVSFHLTLGRGVHWRKDNVSAMQNGKQLSESDVKTVQDYYMKNYK